MARGGVQPEALDNLRSQDPGSSHATLMPVAANLAHQSPGEIRTGPPRTCVWSECHVHTHTWILLVPRCLPGVASWVLRGDRALEVAGALSHPHGSA